MNANQSTAAGSGPPGNDEAIDLQIDGFRVVARNDSTDCAANQPTDQAAKAFETLRARLALAGYELRRNADISQGAAYVVARWGYCCELADLDAVARWAETAIGRRCAQ